jgi:hypothetical protein
MHIAGCEIVLDSSSGTGDGFACGRASMGACAHCETRVCDLHVEECEFCGEALCNVCYYRFHFDQPHKKAAASVYAPTQTDHCAS